MILIFFHHNHSFDRKLQIFSTIALICQRIFHNKKPNSRTFLSGLVMKQLNFKTFHVSHRIRSESINNNASFKVRYFSTIEYGWFKPVELLQFRTNLAAHINSSERFINRVYAHKDSTLGYCKCIPNSPLCFTQTEVIPC